MFLWRSDFTSRVWYGFIKSILVRMFRPINFSDGVLFVTVCGVAPYVVRKSTNVSFRGLRLPLFDSSPFFAVWTYLSACPFELWWYAAVQICFTPISLIKFLKSCDVNCGPLSETSWIGKPYWENHLLRQYYCYTQNNKHVFCPLG